MLQAIFWVSLTAMVYTYVGYPLLLWWLSRGRSLRTLCYGPDEQWPQISVLMAVHNEERVISRKMESLLEQTYPQHLVTYWIGSDCSTDATNNILQAYADKDDRVRLSFYYERQGKPGIINQLASLAQQLHPASEKHIFIITDASVILGAEVMQQLVRHFKTPQLAIVDAVIVHTGLQSAGISRSEDAYISGEARIKQRESILWKMMVGPFGGCYALRSDYFSPVPSTFLVDDFYITMCVFERGGYAINDPSARCYEPVGHEIEQEFRRKARISAGNFQNMRHFRKLWWPPIGLPQFAFFSHKILRWLGPFWLLLLLLSSLLLAFDYTLYRLALGGLVLLIFLLPAADFCLRWFGFHWLPLRHVRYFVLMNLALFTGFVRYYKGIRTNVWQPPKRA